MPVTMLTDLVDHLPEHLRERCFLPQNEEGVLLVMAVPIIMEEVLLPLVMAVPIVMARTLLVMEILIVTADKIPTIDLTIKI